MAPRLSEAADRANLLERLAASSRAMQNYVDRGVLTPERRLSNAAMQSAEALSAPEKYRTTSATSMAQNFAIGMADASQECGAYQDSAGKRSSYKHLFVKKPSRNCSKHK